MIWLSALLAWIKGGGSAKLSINAGNPEVNTTSVGNKKSKSKVVFKNNGPVLYIGENASEEEIKQLKKTLLPEFNQDKVAFIEESAQKEVVSYQDFTENGDVKQTLEFFKDKLGSLDFRLLETGLYINYMVGKNQPTTNIKSDVVKRYGDRGKNVINLATAGYFDSQIKPLYLALSSQPDFTKYKFELEYEKLINDLPYTIFVHSGQSESEILEIIQLKAERYTKYAVYEDKIALHGYDSNVDKMEKLIPELKQRYEKVESSVKYVGELKVGRITIFYKEPVD